MAELWSAVQPDGTYKNPILYADYSDPDVIRVGEDYFMISSSFTYVPGIPLLHSRDLIHWELINYCVKELPFAHYANPVHGSGIWAPALRYHEGTYYVVFPMPDEGIFVTTAKDPWGEWSEPHCIVEAKGWIDPCPIWEEDGKAYIIFAYAKSRCGIKHRLSIFEVDPLLREKLTEPVLVYNGETENPVVEGPKLYKRNGWYYIFAPAGGVEEGWQLVFRSRNIYGPYEHRMVLHQGHTEINGPHQGAWVDTPKGGNWFLHFTDQRAYGRVLCLEPMHWEEDWPVMGVNQNEKGTGEPVSCWKLPEASVQSARTVSDSCDDDFSSSKLNLHWQWQANPRKEWYSLTERPGYLRLYAMNNEKREENLLWYAGNTCTQMLQAPEFEVSVQVELAVTGREQIGDLAGMGILGVRYHYLALERTETGVSLRLYRGEVQEKEMEGKAAEELVWERPLNANHATLRMSMHSLPLGAALPKYGYCRYSYSVYGNTYEEIPMQLPFSQATWTGAKFSLIALNRKNRKSEGYGDFSELKFY